MQNFLTFFYSLENDEIRDLTWIVFAAPLLSSQQHFFVELNLVRQNWLKQLDASPPKELTTARYHLRLGRYHKYLWAYFFQHDKQYKLIAHNIVIYKNKMTFGEIDFLIKNQLTQDIIHLEVAFKFFLHASGEALNKGVDYSKWIGPQPQDSLAKKHRQLYRQQSLHCSTPEAKTCLEERRLPLPNLNHVSFKGMLFRKINTASTPNHFNPSNRMHTYLRINELMHYESEHWRLLSKNDWICQKRQKENEQLLSTEALLKQLSEYNAPVMVELHRDNVIADNAVRLFIMPNQWPIF